MWEDELPTAWYYGVATFDASPLAGINPVGLIERGLESVLGSGSSAFSRAISDPYWEDFETVDGRVGSSLFATLRAARLHMPPGADGLEPPGELGLALGVVGLPGLPQIAAMIIGVSPTVEERAAMAVFASVMAHSVHVAGDGLPELPMVDITLDEAFGGAGSRGG